MDIIFILIQLVKIPSRHFPLQTNWPVDKIDISTKDPLDVLRFDLLSVDVLGIEMCLVEIVYLKYIGVVNNIKHYFLAFNIFDY